jgi:hypothetical protein
MAEAFGWFILSVVVIGFFFVALAVTGGALLGRRACRRLSGFSSVVSGRTSDWARAVADPTQGQVGRLRRRLETELRGLEAALAERADGRVFTADGQVMLARLHDSAADLDAELRAVAEYLQPERRAAAVAVLRPQVEQLIDATYSARQTILETAAQDRSRRLDSLSADIQREADALARYRKSPEDLSL